MRKVKSLPINLNTQCISNMSSISYHDFEKLIMGGQQTHLTFGKYSDKKNQSKENRKKIMQYFYKKMHSKL